MATQFLTVRLNQEDALIVSRLRARTGLTKSKIVKQARRQMERQSGASGDGSLFELVAQYIGRHGNATRQSADVKRVVRGCMDAKRTA